MGKKDFEMEVKVNDVIIWDDGNVSNILRVTNIDQGEVTAVVIDSCDSQSWYKFIIDNVGEVYTFKYIEMDHSGVYPDGQNRWIILPCIECWKE